ncbi:MAG: 16S rRNA (guanine(527)-N(7))-methyltransferase RsmG [Deltaproteobacteria bacterium]|jgi:16S rRNA (guanine527-N7)-methyltransferase|nr:16S rRNA (guanine(527)-N(7))-methyltransferase RsmG [Deltaproteobacteria bacterium]
MSTAAKIFFRNSLEKLNITLDSSIRDSIFDYFNDLLDRNKVINLISRQSTLFDSITVHLVDSLTPLQIDLPKKAKMLDLGSGGGLPGMPLLLALQSWKGILAESKEKKSAFLSEMADKYGNGRISVFTEFIDSKGKSLPEKASSLDVVTARAVDKLSSIISSVSHLIKKDGFLIAYKGPNYLEELKQAEKYLSKSNMLLDKKLEFTLPFVTAKRTLLFFRKIK